MAKAKKKDTNSKPNAYGDGLVNIISKGTKVVGNIEIENDIRLDGIIEGDIASKSKVIIGENGVLKGNLQCEFADVVGSVFGNIQCDNLSLRATAKIEGDMQVKFLTIEPGAVFNGTCSMSKNANQVVSVQKEGKL